MSLGRRILLFPLTRLAIWLGVAGILYLPLSRLTAALPIRFIHGRFAEALTVTLALLLVAWLVERRTAADVGFRLEGAVQETVWGFLLGGVLLTAVIGIMALGGLYIVKGTNVGAAGIWSRLGWNLVAYLWVGVSEEVALRGLFFRLIEEWLGSGIALFLSALLFGLLHIFNPNATLLAAIAVGVEAGVLLAGAYMLTRNLWLAIGIHWAWNFFEGPIYGTAVSGSLDGSGVITSGLLRPELHGPVLWTGGGFGPEAGLVTLVVCTIAGLLMVQYAARSGHWMALPWRRR